jgi:hypothetical protein
MPRLQPTTGAPSNKDEEDGTKLAWRLLHHNAETARLSQRGKKGTRWKRF